MKAKIFLNVLLCFCWALSGSSVFAEEPWEDEFAAACISQYGPTGPTYTGAIGLNKEAAVNALLACIERNSHRDVCLCRIRGCSPQVAPAFYIGNLADELSGITIANTVSGAIEQCRED